MMMSEMVAEQMFVRLKRLSDYAQESCLALHGSGVAGDLLKEHRHLMGEILGRSYDPFLRKLISAFEAPTMERLRERIPLPAPMSAWALMEAVVAEGDLLFGEFGEVMRQGEREGFFREGGAADLIQELARFKAWLAEHGHARVE